MNVIINPALNPGPTLAAQPQNSGGWVGDPSVLPIQLTVTDPDGIAEARYRWNAAAGSGVGTTYTNNEEIDIISGSNYLYLYGRDNLGSSATAGPIGPYQLDDIPPSAPGNLACSPEAHTPSVNHTCTWTASNDTYSGLVGYDVYESTNGGFSYSSVDTVSAITLQWTSSGRPMGTYLYRVYARDGVGWATPSAPSNSVVVDGTNPNPTTCSPLSSPPTYASPLAVTCTVGTDLGSPTTAVTARFLELAGTTPPSGTPSCDPASPSPAWSNRSYNVSTSIKIRTCDAAGNGSSAASYSYSITSNSAPIMPYNPAPASAGIIPASQPFSFYSGDNDTSDVITYDVFISQPNAALSYPLDKDNVLPVSGFACPSPGCIFSYGPAQLRSPLQQGAAYQWRVEVKDGLNSTLGPLWTFTVNSPPIITALSINPTTINTSATISWTFTDQVNGPSYTYTPRYVNGAPVFNGTLAAIGAPSCNVVGTTHTCSAAWDTNCMPEATDYYLLMQVDDGIDIDRFGDVVGEERNFTVSHYVTYYYPPDPPTASPPSPQPYNTVGLSSPGNQQTFATGQYWVRAGASRIQFRNSCSSAITNLAVEANGSGNPTQLSTLNPGEVSAELGLDGLTPDSANILVFTGTAASCSGVDYRLHYDLYTANCTQPYLQVRQGSIYSSGDIKARTLPPDYSAEYLVLAGGTLVQPKTIQNFRSNTTQLQSSCGSTCASFGRLPYPGAANIFNQSQPQIGSFDYYGLVHTASGVEVDNGANNKNLYGYTVRVFDAGVNTWSAAGLGTNLRLDGKVYYFKGDLTVDQSLTFLNGTSTSQTRGNGLMLVDGRLTFASDVAYDPVSLLPSASLTDLPSVGWMVGDRVETESQVVKLVGAFYVGGYTTGATGRFSTGAGMNPLEVYGPIIAKAFSFDRRYAAGPSELVVADGRITINTPPGFGDVLRTLPTWVPKTP